MSDASSRLTGRTDLYRCFNDKDRLLYIGVTANRVQRFGEHRRSSAWWPLVARTEVTAYELRTHALDAEATAIRDEKPLYNVVHSNAVPIRLAALIADFNALTPDIQAAKLGTEHEGHAGWVVTDRARCSCGTPLEEILHSAVQG